jgi:hypothetical protein
MQLLDFEIELQHESLKPKLGTYIITKEPLTDREDVSEGIRFIETDFEQNKLLPIIRSLGKNTR